jgi:hypothetical protein
LLAQSQLHVDSEDIQSYQDKVVALIESAVNLKTTRVKQKNISEIFDPLTKTQLFKIEGNKEVIEVPSHIFLKILGECETDALGFYDMETGKIFLDREKWCFSTLIHETLHSRSVFSQSLYHSNLEFVADGLTELFVGLILEKALSDCHKQWQTIDDCFHNYYEEKVQTWHYLTFKMSFEPIIRLYFDLSIKNPLKELGKILESTCKNDCADLFANYNPQDRSFYKRFQALLNKAFPTEFTEFMSSDLRDVIKLKQLT